MKTNPLVSVVLATYNRRFLLPYAIESILGQTYPHYEVIIVNDCGEDVWDIVESFGSNKIRYVSHIKNFGQPSARNTALKIANGDIICYLDDDDIFLDNHLELLVKAYENHDVDVVYTDALLVAESIEKNERIIIEKKNMFNISHYTYRRLQIQNYIPINTLSHKQKIVSEVGLFDEELSSLEDWEFLLHLGKKYTFYHIEQTSVEVRYNARSISNVSSKEQLKAPQMYRKIYTLHPTNEADINAQRSLVVLRLTKDNILLKKSLGFALLQLHSIQKEIGKYVYYSLCSILRREKTK